MLWETENHSSTDEVQSFTEEPKHLEQKLLPYDILGNLAHIKMLTESGYLTKTEHMELKEELQNLYEDQPEVTGEDVHTFVEEKITETTDVGKKIHTGRSRNDQIVLDTRLYMKDAAIGLSMELLSLVETLEKFGKDKNELIPGYTHQQQAMPSSTGLWISSFADALIDDLKLLESVYDILDQNPLGAAASYGTTLDIDREMTAELLGFNAVQENPIYAVGSRGKQELMLIQALNHVMLDLQKLSEDMINFSEDQEIFILPDKFCTGSSIMPQKRNPDVLELIRAKAEEVNSHESAVRGIIAKLPSGYNRDTQATKKHLFAAIDLTKNSVSIINDLIKETEISDNFNVDESIFAAYTANQMVEDGNSFREAYKEIKESQNYLSYSKPQEPKNQEYSEIKTGWKHRKENWEKCQKNLLI